LIYGLESLDWIDLSLDVPSRLLGGLVEKRFDVALLPVIDYQRMSGLRLLTAGGIGCDGPTLTVRIFSREPMNEIRALACDTDSHTSVALARVVLAERFGIRPTIVDFDFHRERNPVEQTEVKVAQLLIGDKVVCQEPHGYPHQIDLGQAWKELTGLPFVFAAWMARDGVGLGTLPAVLERARRSGLRHVDEIIEAHAVPRGWPAHVARQYLTEYLKFDIGPQHLEAIRLFHRLAHKHGIIPHVPRELDVVEAERR
jgi:chorismate dehydratase